MGEVIEVILFIFVIVMIYQMFFSKKESEINKENKLTYDENNYITPVKEENSYTPEAPTGDNKPYAEVLNQDNGITREEINKTNTYLGNASGGVEKFYINDKELNGMCLLVGATGAGKTECIKTILERPLIYNDPIIIVDGKGDPKFPNEMKELCDRYNRNFKLFNTTDYTDSRHYNPLRHGQFTELKDKLISIFDWSEDYYKNQAERFLQGTFRLLLLPETKELLQYEVVDLNLLNQVFSIDVISNLIEQLGECADFMQPILNEADQKAINGFAGRLKTIAESELGELFKDTQNENVIDLCQSIECNDVIFFSLNSLQYQEYAQMLGKLIISDLKTVAPKFAGKNKNIYTVFDEFNVFASEIIVNLINKTRSFGFRNIMGTQELADMTVNGDNKLLNQILGNTNVKICLRQDVVSSQDLLARSVGTKDIYKSSISITKGIEGREDNKSHSVTLEEDFHYKSREFGCLGTGEAIVFVKTPNFRHAKIKVRLVN